MLENGANSSFVNQIYDRQYKPHEIANDPIEVVRKHNQKKHPKIVLPKNLYGDFKIRIQKGLILMIYLSSQTYRII